MKGTNLMMFYGKTFPEELICVFIKVLYPSTWFYLVFQGTISQIRVGDGVETFRDKHGVRTRGRWRGPIHV